MSPDSMTNPPYILTLQLDDHTFQFLDHLRYKYFPRHLNFLRAHVTLFHKLPREVPTLIFIEACCQQISCFPFTITNPVFTGRGVGLKIESLSLSILHRRMAEHWASVLSPQDKQPFKPHVTVQNKVEPPVARMLYDDLVVNFATIQGKATGLILHEYLGGPWRTVATFPFVDSE